MPVPISNVTRRVVYAASGTGPYNFTFEILAAGDIAVYRDDTLLTLTTNYTVTINSNGTGFVTLTAAPTGATQIAIVGNRTIARTTDFVTGGDFFANTLNDELDQQTIFNQQNAEGLQRALQAPQTDPTTIDMTLPRASVRANKTLAFDANGDPTTGEVIGDNRGNWASGVAYNKRDIVKDTSTGNIYYCNTSHTSSGSQPITTNTDSAKWDLFVDNASADAAQVAAEAAQAAAEAAQAAAETAEANAETAETNAETAATNAANSATAAASSASTASTAATNASNSATAAATSATNASNSASSASTSASNASTSATNAANSASSASTSASNASTSATSAANSASSASSSASTATTQATNASSSASAAATSASNAATSETNAANSASAAAASAASAANTFDSFDDRYLGTKASDPTLDNDGNALVSGALYFSTSQNIMKVYDGASWIAATSAGNTSLLRYRYVATSGQTTFSGSDSNAATLSYTVNNIVVFLNGVALDQTEYTATSGTSVVLGAGAALNDELVVVAFKSFVTADMVPASTGGTYAGAVRFAAGSASVPSISVDGDTNTGIFYPAADTVAIGTGGTERLRVDSAGNMGIGTSSPSQALDIAGGNINTSSTAYLMWGGSNSYAIQSVTGASGYMRAFVNGAERMRLDASGYLLVGATSSDGVGAARFQLGSTNATSGLLTKSNTSWINLYASSGNDSYITWKPTTGGLLLGQGPTDGSTFTERARFTSAGYSKFSDNGTYYGSTGTFHEFYQSANDTGLAIKAANASYTNNGLIVDISRNTTNNSFSAISYYNAGAGAYKFRVADSGTVTNTTGTYTTISDIKLKQDIVDASSQWDDIKALRIVKYRLKEYVQNDPDSKPFLGLIAQEVEQVSPGLVEEQEDEVMDEDGKLVKNGEVTKGVKTSILYMKAVKALQEAMTRIEQLEAKVAALENA